VEGIVAERTDVFKDVDAKEIENIAPLPSRLVIPDIPGKEWRDYQTKIIHDCWQAFQEDHTKFYYKLTVAGGKTLTSAAIADNFLREGLPVLWLAHNKKLLSQADEAFKTLGWFGLHEQGQKDAREGFIRGDSKLVIGSVASLRNERLRKWPSDTFALIIYDECDYSLAPKNVELIQYFSSARLLGMTGTDDRGDGKNLGALYGKRILSLNIKEATERQMTVPIICNKIGLSHEIDLRNLKKLKSDFDEHELAEIIKQESEFICSAIATGRNNEVGLGNRPAMAFCPDIASAEIIAENLTKFGISARALHSKLSNKEREDGERDFVAGKFQVLVNAIAYTVGTDFPFVSCIILLRPTQVRRLLEQMVGRGIRLPDNNPLSKGKEDCLVIDFPWIVGTAHSLVHVSEIYNDGSLSMANAERVKEIMEKEKCTHEQALEQLEKEEVLHKEEQAKLRKLLSFQRQSVDVTHFIHDPLEILKLLSETVLSNLQDENETTPQHEAPATADQIESLQMYKIPHPERLNEEQAKFLLISLNYRKKFRLCNVQQIQELLKFGGDPERILQISSQEAKDIIKRHQPFEQLKEAYSEFHMVHRTLERYEKAKLHLESVMFKSLREKRLLDAPSRYKKARKRAGKARSLYQTALASFKEMDNENVIQHKEYIDDFERVVAPLRKKMDAAITQENLLHDEYKVSIGEISKQKRKETNASKRIIKAKEAHCETLVNLVGELDWMDKNTEARPSTSNDLTVRSWVVLTEVLAVYLWHIAWDNELHRLCKSIFGQHDYKSISFSKQLKLFERMLALANEIVDLMRERDLLNKFDWRDYMSSDENEEDAKWLAGAALRKDYMSYNKNPSSVEDSTTKSWFVRAEVLAAYLWRRKPMLDGIEFCSPFTERFDYNSIGFSEHVQLLEQMFDAAMDSKRARLTN
jgi:superfamily II DNA or RNA helicase